MVTITGEGSYSLGECPVREMWLIVLPSAIVVATNSLEFFHQLMESITSMSKDR
jgi:hypothetical protein